jgi:Probable cobalt transporter subunit (CbtB)
MDDALELERVKVPVWTWLLVALLIAAVYMVTVENGAALGSAAENLHEFFHDARHFAGVPCH